MSRFSRICAMSLVFGATGLFAQTVKVNWQTKVDFSQYHTYYWVVNKHQRQNDFYRPWIKHDVNAQLAKKGWTLAPSLKAANVYLDYHSLAEQLNDAVTTSDDSGIGWGMGGGWGGMGGFGGWGDMGGDGDMGDMSTTQVEPRLMGIITIDVKDPKIKEIVWRGQATVDSVSNSQKGDEKQVGKSVEKMFKDFPPKSNS